MTNGADRYERAVYRALWWMLDFRRAFKPRRKVSCRTAFR